MYLYKALKDKTMPTIEEMVTAIKKADNPDPEQRDERPLMSSLMRMSSSGERLGGHLRVRRTAITAFDWYLKPYEEADRERAKEAQGRIKKVAQRTLNIHTRTPGFGALAVQLTWPFITGVGAVPQIVRRYKPVEISRDGDDLDHLYIIGEDDKPNKLYDLSVENPQEWVVESDDEVFDRGAILRSLLPGSILRHENLQEWANFNRKVKGLVLAQYNEHADDQTINTAVQTLKNLTKNNFSVTTDDIKYEFAKIVDQIGAQSFAQFKKALDDDASISLLGQANTSELPSNGGSRAALEVLNYIRADIHFADMQRVEQLMNEQLVLWDFQLNGVPNAMEAPWRFVIRINEERDPEREANAAKVFLTFAPLSREEVYERCGYNVPADGEDVIAVNTGMPAFGG